IEAGYLARRIPKVYGGSEQEPDVLKATIISEEFARAAAPGEAMGLGPNLLVPTLLDHGDQWQKEKFIGPTMRGEIRWCQGYSEPGSGSDLASLQTRAELQGDEWVINGQKIWTSGAQAADYMFCLCRTEPDVSKHAGISYLLIDMKQPGIEVRPLKQMTGDSHFNEVFFSDAKTPADWIVGERGQGWIVSRSTLKHERNMIGNASRTEGLFRSVLKLAQRSRVGGRPAIEDPAIRRRLAELEGYVMAHKYSGYRLLTHSARGQDPGIMQSMNKLFTTNFGHEIAKLSLDLIGDGGLVGPSARAGLAGAVSGTGAWVNQYMGSLGSAIAGGTANIQRNIIAERGLGLPRDRAAETSK
ncbi:MAG: acyl-CoA dehydrogenase family protein, partial [Deltaproteobacteria bacterium]|nr:acyl-CoA dehydrogenase family protein [Deltaproteobacteria bacterium]